MAWAFDANVAPGWFDYVGLFVALVGFALTIWQTMKSRGAAEAATSALVEARRTLVNNSLLASQNQFQLVVSDLDQAMGSNQVDLAHRTLVRYSHLAKETETLLAENLDVMPLREKLLASSELALDTKEKIVQSKSPDVQRLSKAISREVNQVSVDMSAIVAALRLTIDGGE